MWIQIFLVFAVASVTGKNKKKECLKQKKIYIDNVIDNIFINSEA